MIIQFCGLSGAGKTTLAREAAKKLQEAGLPVEIIDGDEYRQIVSRDLGFSKADRMENIRRLGFIANKFSRHGIVTIICAINPYEEVRNELCIKYNNVKTVFIDCPLQELVKRDTKGLYKKAFLPDGHAEKISNLTGVNDPFEAPHNPHLTIQTSSNTIANCTAQLVDYIVAVNKNAR